jgi:hypothetical protein
VYELLEGSYGETLALIGSACPPLLWSTWELIRTRRLDAISLVVLASILFSVAATALGGSPRLIQVRETLVTGLVGVIFLLSLLAPRPMIFYLARATMARRTVEGSEEFERVWTIPHVPHLLRTLTAVWGTGLVGQTMLMCWLAYLWPVARYILISPLIGYGIFGLLLIWSLWYLARHGATGRAIFSLRATQ